jgi:lariat debranching enzyme
VAPILTIFIGGNHEASNHLQELSYGGWVAPNIYYLGYAGVVQVNGIRIAGISGIYKGYNYDRGHFEITPYNDDTVRSVYSTRKLEVFKLGQLTPSKIDIMLSHDWPQYIWEHGDKSRTGTVEGLLRFKPAFKQDIDSGRLGSKPCWELLTKLKPKHWFAAHMHCRFDAIVKHSDEEQTKFVALDKCLPKRQFFDFIDIGEDVERDENGAAILDFQYDPEWLAILSLTNPFLNCTPERTMIPLEPKYPNENAHRWNFTPSEDEIAKIVEKFKGNFEIPKNFKQITQGYNPEWERHDFRNLKKPEAVLNPQTKEFCDKLGVDDPLLIAAIKRGIKIKLPFVNDQNADAAFQEAPKPQKTQLALPKPVNSEEIDLDSLDDEEVHSPNETSGFEPVIISVQNTTPKSAPAAHVKRSPSTSPPIKATNQVPLNKFKRRNQEIRNDSD